jgi:hypothetical protein
MEEQRMREVPIPDRFDVVKGAITAGLVLSVSVPMATLPVYLRGAAMVLAGRAIAVGVANAKADGRQYFVPWATRIAVIWIATFVPVALPVNPDAVRSGAVAAGLALALSGVPLRFLFALTGALFIASLVLAEGLTLPGQLNGLGYALGVAWPRGWHDVALVVGLFLLGGLWARGGELPSSTWLEPHPVPEWLVPLCALGRFPFVVLLVHSLVISVIGLWATSLSPATVLAGSLVLLLAEMILAQRWLQHHTEKREGNRLLTHR